MRWPRITLQRMMVIVAVAGLASGLEVARRRREALLVLEGQHASAMSQNRQARDLYRANARKQRDQAAKLRRGSVASPRKAETLEGVAGLVEGEARGYGTLADYHERLRDKYRKAARFPFWPVDPDPPPPPDVDAF